MGLTRFMLLACIGAMAASVSGFAVAGGYQDSHHGDRGSHFGSGWQADRWHGNGSSPFKHHDPKPNGPSPGAPGNSGGTPSEVTLQHLFDTQFGPGVLNAHDDVLAEGSEAHWTAEAGATTTLLFEFAGYAPSNVFGIYDSTAPDFRLPLFYGYAGPGSQSSLAVQALASGGYRLTVTSNGISESALFGSSVFGFYLRTPDDQVYFSDTALNGDHTDHLRAYHTNAPGIGDDFVYPEGSYILAWEDLLNGGDRDYNDMIVSVSRFTPSGGTSPVPLPAGIWLLGSGLLGLAGLRRRKPNSIA